MGFWGWNHRYLTKPDPPLQFGGAVSGKINRFQRLQNRFFQPNVFGSFEQHHAGKFKLVDCGIFHFIPIFAADQHRMGNGRWPLERIISPIAQRNQIAPISS